MADSGEILGRRMPIRTDSLRAAFYRFYFKAEKVITPNLRSSQYAYYDALRTQMAPGARWLDLGCGHQVFGEWMTREQGTVLAQSGMVAGIDLDWEGLKKHPGIRRRVYGDLTRLPFQSGAWDIVTANMVMEHLEDPSVVLREVHRLLAPGGLLIFHTPNFYHWGTLMARSLPEGVKKRLIGFFEGRAAADIFETHYRINTAADVRAHAERAGFQVVRIEHVNSSATLKMLGPIVLAELAFIRLIEHSRLAQLRSSLIVTLKKKDGGSADRP
jgi:2-polyprenyl-3-methyl-5-hydroxy-6-metoxy-1,4-benzoquinol methylase